MLEPRRQIYLEQHRFGSKENMWFQALDFNPWLDFTTQNQDCWVALGESS